MKSELTTISLQSTPASILYLASFTTAQGIVLSGSKNGGEIGVSVSSAGDTNNDGYSDFTICRNNGYAYVIYGSDSPVNINLDQLTTTQGFTVQSQYIPLTTAAGDVNRDGYTDTITLNWKQNNYAGISYVLYGSNNETSINLNNAVSSTKGFSITGISSTNGGYEGYSLSSAGDVNGDGYDDVIIGIPFVNNYAGAAYIIYGGKSTENILLSTLKANQGFTISGISNSASHTGYSVSSAGDFNKDGYSDVIVGAPYYNNNNGAIYIIYGSMNPSDISLSHLSTSQGFVFSGASTTLVGTSISNVGDFNKDGYSDVIISSTSTGYVIYGSNNTQNMFSNNISSSQGLMIYVQGGVIASVSDAGDVNGDGYDDVIIGDPAANNNIGVSYVVYGNNNKLNIYASSLNYTQGYAIYGNQQVQGQLGLSVSSAGDVNKDGYADIIVGSPFYGLAGQGYVIYGANTGFVPLTTFSPTVTPTILKSTIPTIAPSSVVTNNPTVVSLSSAPTHTPDALPTSNPTFKPSFAPSIEGTSSPSFVKSMEPSVDNTHSPSSIPTLLSSIVPSFIPSANPTSFPTLMPTQSVNINNGGSYQSVSNTNYIINADSDVSLYGISSNNMYTLVPNQNMKIIITYFDNYTDYINLVSYDIYSFDQLNITSGSVIITLPNYQIMKLANLYPSDVSENNFIFNTAPTPTYSPVTNDNSDPINQGAIIGGVIGGVAFLGLAALGIYYFGGKFFIDNIWSHATPDLSSEVVNPVVVELGGEISKIST